MSIQEPYIPREYLALQINYCKQQLAALPEVRIVQRKLQGITRMMYVSGSHVYTPESPNGKTMKEIYQLRENYLCELSRLEGLWNSTYRRTPPADIMPRKNTRKLYVSEDEFVILDSNYFNSLKNDANPFYPEHKTHYFNGIYYRSPAEANIARFYTEQKIPFKYEPEIWIKGINHPIYSDFVVLFEELNQCKFHEHFGLKNSSDYTRKTATTYINYSGAGLLPGIDVFYTYDLNDVPFDLRVLHTQINSVVYNSLFMIDNCS